MSRDREFYRRDYGTSRERDRQPTEDRAGPSNNKDGDRDLNSYDHSRRSSLLASDGGDDQGILRLGSTSRPNLHETHSLESRRSSLSSPRPPLDKPASPINNLGSRTEPLNPVASKSPSSLPTKVLAGSSSASAPGILSVGRTKSTVEKMVKDPRLLSRVNTTASTAGPPSVAGEPPDLDTKASQNRKVRTDADVTMEDVPPHSATSHLPPNGSLPFVQSPESEGSSEHSLEALIALVTGYAEQSAFVGQQMHEQSLLLRRAERNDIEEKKSADFNLFPAWVEKNKEKKRTTDKELAAVNQKLDEHKRIRTDLARAMATHVLDQNEQRRRALDDAQRAKESSQRRDDDLSRLEDRVREIAADVGKNNSFFQDVNSLSKTMKAHLDHFRRVEDKVNILGQVQEEQGILFNQQKELHNKFGPSLEKIASHDLGTRLTDLDKAVVQCAAARTEIRTEIDTQARKIEELALSIERQSKEMEMSRCSQAFEESQKAISKLSSITEKLEQEAKHLHDYDRVLSDQMDLTAPKSEVALLEEKVDKMRAEICDIQALDPRANAHMDSSQPSNQPLTAVAEAKSDIDALRTQLNRLQELVNARDSDLNDVIDNDRIGRQAISSIQTELVVLHETHEASNTLLSNEVERLNTKLDQNETQRGKLDAELRADAVKAKDDLQNIENQLTTLSKRVDSSVPVRPTPPSAPPTPQLQNPAPLPSQAIQSPKLDFDLSSRISYIEGRLGETINLVNRQGAHVQAQDLSFRSLDSRYNNLSTEPMVKQMVYQMQQMYPFASQAHAEISALKTAVGSMQKLSTHVSLLNDQVNQHAKDLLRVDEKTSSHEQDRGAHGAKQDQLLAVMKEERDKLKAQHDILQENFKNFQGQHVTLKNDLKNLKDQQDALGKQLNEVQRQAEIRDSERQGQLQEGHNSLEIRVGYLEQLLKGDPPPRKSTQSPAQASRVISSESGDDDLLSKFRGRPPKRHVTRKADIEEKGPDKKLKRKRRARSQEINEPSDDDTYKPEPRSSPAAKRKNVRGR